MKRIDLRGVDALGNVVPVKSAVVEYTDFDRYFSVRGVTGLSLTLVTPKGSYQLNKHRTMGIYLGVCGGHKVHVSIKKTIGEIRYW
jgi:hypothetical protein